MEKKRDHRPDFKRPEKPHLRFFQFHFVSLRKKRFLVDAENQLHSTCGMGAGWYQLEIQALKLCASRLEEQIMWCSTNQPMPASDPHPVESFSASKENQTCEDNGMMISIVEN